MKLYIVPDVEVNNETKECVNCGFEYPSEYESDFCSNVCEEIHDHNVVKEEE